MYVVIYDKLTSALTVFRLHQLNIIFFANVNGLTFPRSFTYFSYDRLAFAFWKSKVKKVKTFPVYM